MMKKKVGMKMDQVLMNEDFLLELGKLHMVLFNSIPKTQDLDQKQDDLSQCLNPNYPKEIISLEEAKNQINKSDIIASSRYNIFGLF